MVKNDSLHGTAGIGARTRNPANMRCVDDIFMPDSYECAGTAGNGVFASFASMKQGVEQNAALYVRRYAGKSPDEITRVWAGNPQSGSYWSDIRSCYPS